MQIRLPFLLFTCFGLSVAWLNAQKVANRGAAQSSVEQRPKGSPITKLEKTTLSAPVFIANMGQFDPKVKFQAKIGSQAVWLTNEGVVFDATRPAAKEKVVTADPRTADSTSGQNPLQPFALRRARPESRMIDRLVFSEDFVGASCCSKVEGKNPQPGVHNYFQSGDPKEWRTNVRGYAEVVYRDVWAGIDLRIYGYGSDLEQEFIVRPGGDLSNVQMNYRGIDQLGLAKDGSLEVATAFGILRETKPRIYQELAAGQRMTVDGVYKLLSKSAYTFDTGGHDPLYALVVDPTLLYSTFLGGSAGNQVDAYTNEYATGIAVDAPGNAYVAGNTTATDFPTTVGAFQVSPASGSFVTKLNANGSTLIYSTYLGASSQIGAITVDALGDAFVTGFAGSGFPVTPSAYSPTNSLTCGSDFFVTELNPAGNGLVYSTCMGITGQYYGAGGSSNAIAVDAHGRVFIAGGFSGCSPCSYPTTANAYQTSNPGNRPPGFVTILDTTASGTASLIYSTYFGITGNHGGFGVSAEGVAVDTQGGVYITGSAGPGLVTTPGAFQPAAAAGGSCNYPPNAQVPCPNAFIAKLNPSASGAQSLIYATYLGGPGLAGNRGVSGISNGSAIAVDSSGNAYVTGQTYSASFPVTTGAFQTSGSGTAAAFVTKLNAGGSNLVYSTYLCTNVYSTASGNAIAVDSLGNAYVAGNFGGNPGGSFPVTTDAFQNSFTKTSGDSQEAFLTKLNAAGSGLVYSSYLGGNGDDVATAVAIDRTGDAYVAGHTGSANFPISGSAFQPTVHGTGDAFVTKFPLGTSQTLSISSLVPISGGNAGTVTPQIFGTGLHEGAIAKLNCGGQSIVGANLSVGPGGRFLNTTFNLAGVSPGTCDVVVTNPDGASLTLSQAFTVQQGGAPNIQFYLTGLEARKVPSEVGTGPADALIIATVSNVGSVDATGGVVSIPLNSPFTLTSSSSSTGSSNVAQDLSGDFEVLLTGPIAAGTSQTLTVTATTATAPVCNVSSTLVKLACIAATASDLTAPLVAGLIAACEYQELLNDGTACGEALDSCNTAFVDCNEQSEFSPVCWVDVGLCLQDALECSRDSGPAVAACVQKYASICISGQFPCRQPADPNSLVGPPGVGGQRWITGGKALSYAISFSNEPTASVPAQQVVVTQPLGTNVNLSTLTLPVITLPNNGTAVTVTIPAGAFNPAANVNEFITNVDLRPTQSLLVNVDAKLNPATQTLTWTFTSIDPATGLPPLNPLIGFLPPGAGANVSFSVTPKPGLATGSQVAEQATIIFQGASPMSTSTWTNTIDNTPPVSHISALSAASTCPAFRVSWSGSDVGSGLQGFTVYVSDTGAPYTAWLSNTTAASADFIGVIGHSYSFYSIATDLTGNTEGGKTSPEASTSVTASGPCGAPNLTGSVSNVQHTGTTVTLDLQLTNTGFTAAQAVNINQITFRTLSGSGTVTIASPILPEAEGPLGIGVSKTVPIKLNVPATVTRFSITEAGNLKDGAGNTYNYSMAQTVIP